MMINLIPFVAGWIALACAVLGLAIYRRMLSTRTDEMLHVLDSEAAHVSEQAVVAHQLDLIDRWGKILTIVAVVTGILLAGLYLYRYWMQSSQQLWQ
jgi:hypothetical protein